MLFVQAYQLKSLGQEVKIKKKSPTRIRAEIIEQTKMLYNQSQ